MNPQVLTNLALFDGDTVLEGHIVVIDKGRIASIGPASQAPSGIHAVDLQGHLLAPGLIDLQVNGGGGVLFNDAPTAGSVATIVGAHRRFGTTGCLPTLITDNADVMRQGIRAVEQALSNSSPGVLGIHLEGPHLNSEYRGVHDAARMRPLDDDALALLCSLSAGRTLVTVAPETMSLEAISLLRDAGVIVFGGHSAASYDETQRALESGMSGFTHLFNAMTPLTSRAPGMVGAALDDANSFIGIIADGHHIHPATLRIAIRAKTRGKVCLVTDAMPTVGSQDKYFTLQGETISARGGRCVTGQGTLAGSDIGMIDAVRNTVAFGGADRYEALRMASRYPASVLGLDDEIGYVRPGYRADLIQIDDDFKVIRNWVRGDMESYL